MSDLHSPLTSEKNIWVMNSCLFYAVLVLYTSLILATHSQLPSTAGNRVDGSWNTQLYNKCEARKPKQWTSRRWKLLRAAELGGNSVWVCCMLFATMLSKILEVKVDFFYIYSQLYHLLQKSSVLHMVLSVCVICELLLATHWHEVCTSAPNALLISTGLQTRKLRLAFNTLCDIWLIWALRCASFVWSPKVIKDSVLWLMVFVHFL